jgi:HAD superfamily hydrolase (TIGR01458 family)
MKNNIPILIDFDGVIRLGSRLAEDASKFLIFLHDENIPFFIITNSTRETAEDLKKIIYTNGIKFKINAMTTVDATVAYLNEKNLRISVYCNKNIRSQFVKFINDENPQAVVIGDLGNEWSYDILNEIFIRVYKGAEIIAMQKNKFWQPDGSNLALDAGAFIAAIEFATGKKSTLIGKPSPIYFHTALNMLGGNIASTFLMIGDDLENDINAAQEIGGKGILIYTGKTKYPLPKNSAIKPNYEANNLSEIIDLIKNTFM